MLKYDYYFIQFLEHFFKKGEIQPLLKNKTNNFISKK